MAAVKGAVLGKPIFVLCDNVYNLLCEGDCPDLSLDAQCANQVLVCQSFSKPWAMTGWRVGYLTAPGYVMERLLLLSAAEIASVPTFVQAAAVEALRTDPGPLAEIFRRHRGRCCPGGGWCDLRLPQWSEGAVQRHADQEAYC